ncbi:hypothetical protein [Gynuella sp.]|uniref:hypothetical protein n=1 Tax=Gynuella sp. TaxID=2969146 RepID=UPI003D13AEEA
MPVTVDTRRFQLLEKLDVLYQEGFLIRTGKSLEITTPEYQVVPAYEFNLAVKGKDVFDRDLGFAVAELRFVKLEQITWPVDGDIRTVNGVFRYRYASVPEWIWAPAFDHYLDALHMRENLKKGYHAEFSMKYSNQNWVIDEVKF